MWYQINQYLKFLIKSNNQHGIHSPFVYQLVTQCFYDHKKHASYKIISAYRNLLKHNKTVLDITDLGAGSKVMRSNKRKVSELLKYNSATLKRSKLLYRISRYFNANTILELGTSLGVGALAMSLGNPKASIFSIEGCPKISKFTASQLQNLDISNLIIKTGNFNQVIPLLDQKTFDLIYIDGNHQKEPTLKYFKSLLKHSHNNTVFIFDDIYWSKEMTEAWHIIQSHQKVSVTIDTFYCGLVFFRKEQEKQHFRIRV